MKEEKIDPDSVIFLSVLKACSHAGLVSKARDVFNDMIESHDIPPTIEHYNCMLDVLGRAGQLMDALLWIEKMPLKPNIVTWNALLAACQKWRNVEVARRAFDGALRLDAKQATCFIVMSSIYNDAGMRVEAMEIDELRAAAMHA
jgi:pentatricopeptide repeat protein